MSNATSLAPADAPLNAAGFVKSQIRTVPDWPQAGVQFRDITPLLQQPKAMRVLIDLFVLRYIDAKLDYIAGLDEPAKTIATELWTGAPTLIVAGDFAQGFKAAQGLSDADFAALIFAAEDLAL